MKQIAELKEEALKNEVPIMMDEGMEQLKKYILEHHVKSILEIGSAVGYSAICMADLDPDIHITTIEKEEARYLEAVKNVQETGKSEQITCVLKDALEFVPNQEYDLLFIDAAKAAYLRFFQRFSPYVKVGGSIVVDDVYFYGFVDDISQVRTRRLRQMIQKLINFREMLLNHPDYETTYSEIGNGILFAKKIH